MPDLNLLVEIFSKDNVEFISIVWDKENLSNFLSSHQFNYLHGYSNDYIFQLLEDGFPRNIIIGKDGVILYNKIGGSENRHLELEKVISDNL